MSTSTSVARQNLQLQGPFDLARSAAFEFGYHEAESFEGAVRLAVVRDDYQGQAGAVVRQPTPDRLEIEVVGDGDPAPVAAQVARMLSVDVDATSYAELTAADPLLEPLAAGAPGLRPPLFSNAYEALAWAVLSARRPRRQMLALRERLARKHGRVFTLGGQDAVAFPTPEALLEMGELPGLPEIKVRRLHGVARAALDGLLDTEKLRTAAPDEAAATVRRLDGIGPFYAELVTVRALGHTDVLPSTEPTVREVLGSMTDAAQPLSPSAFADLAERWRPWRTWVCVLIRSQGPAWLKARDDALLARR